MTNTWDRDNQNSWGRSSWDRPQEGDTNPHRTNRRETFTWCGVLGQVGVPINQVEEGKGQREEDAGVDVDPARSGQLRELRNSRTLLEEDGQVRHAVAHRVVPPLQAFLKAAVRLVGGGGGEQGSQGQVIELG